MTDRLARMKEIAKAATPGPWYMDEEQVASLNGKLTWIDPLQNSDDDNPLPVKDVEFISTFHPSRVLALLELVEEAKEVLIMSDVTPKSNADIWLSKLSEFQNEGGK